MFPSINGIGALMEEISALREVVAEHAEQIRGISKGTGRFEITMAPSTGMRELSPWLDVSF